MNYQCTRVPSHRFPERTALASSSNESSQKQCCCTESPCGSTLECSESKIFSTFYFSSMSRAVLIFLFVWLLVSWIEAKSTISCGTSAHGGVIKNSLLQVILEYNGVELLWSMCESGSSPTNVPSSLPVLQMAGDQTIFWDAPNNITCINLYVLVFVMSFQEANFSLIAITIPLLWQSYRSL